MRPADELLYDSEASFRLVDHAIRETAGMLDSRGVDKLEEMRGHLQEASSATELATHAILGGLARAISLVEQLDGAATDADRGRMMASLREELGGIVNQLQFQDVTAQQLKHLEGQLADMNRRIAHLAKVFTPRSNVAVGGRKST
jgi:hypothetical protein